MAWMGLTVDGRYFRVRVVYDTLARAFELMEGVNAGDMMSGRHERDLKGTGFSYSMQIEPDPDYQTDYDALFDLLSDPVNTHAITVPYGQGTLTYEAEITDGSDVYDGMLSGVKRWKNFQVNFRYISPQKEAPE